jgi:hypothetical protein
MISNITASSIHPSSLEPQDVLKNYQKWNIQRKISCDGNSPFFELRDAWGCEKQIKNCVVTDLDEEFANHLLQLPTQEEQQQAIINFLQSKLEKAHSYAVHVIQDKGQDSICFGSYGLQGGVGIGNLETSRMGALILSAAQVGLGFYMCLKQSPVAPECLSIMLLSSGLTSGSYALLPSHPHFQFNKAQYMNWSVYGASFGWTWSKLAPIAYERKSNCLAETGLRLIPLTVAQITLEVFNKYITSKICPVAQVVYAQPPHLSRHTANAGGGGAHTTQARNRWDQFPHSGG